jgi:cobalt-zinc-cadmium efflux system outer membrane protein
MHKLLTPILIALAGLAGCQKYRPSPLDIGDHGSRWETRDPASAEVADYAARLAKLDYPMLAPFDLSDGMSLREAEVVALFFNPKLRVARLKANVPLLGAREAGRWEDPQLAIDGERIVKSVDEPWVLGGTINFTIPISGRLRVERARAFAEADAERLRAYVEETAVVAELRTAWAELFVTGERRAVATQYLKELDDVLRSAESLLKAREIDTTDARLFRVERATRRAELQALESDYRQKEAAVKSLLGLIPAANVQLVPSLLEHDAISPSTMQRQWIQETHPRLLLLRAEYAASEKALELEIRKQYPDLAIGGGFGTDEGQSRILFGAGLPLPLLNRNRRGIAEALAGRDVAKAAAESGYEELVSQLARAELAAEAAHQQRQSLETEVIPLVDEQVRELRQLGRLGDFNTLILLEALRTAYEAKTQLLNAALRQATTRNELNALSGTAVPPRPSVKDRKR